MATKAVEIPAVMQAVKVVEYGAPVEIQEVQVKRPGLGQVLLAVEVCGLCHTDVHVQSGDWDDAKCELPRTLGHEVIGRVVELGAGVGGESPEDLRLGDRVCVPWLHWTCGTCEFCLRGWESVCSRQLRTGFSADGGFAQYCLAYAAFVVRVPPNLSSEQAAPITCAGVTAYKALKVANIHPGNYVAIVGAAGGIGHLAIQYAKAMGLIVIAIDCRNEGKIMKQWGADYTIDASSTKDLATEVKRYSDGLGVHATVILAPSTSVIAVAVKYTRPLGTVVLVGLPPGHLDASIFDIVLNAITIRGSIVGTRQDLHEALNFAAEGKVHCTVQTRPFAEIKTAMHELMEGKITGRVVIKI